MEYDTLAKVLREARDIGIRFITVSGGEPYLYPHLFRMAEEFSDLMFMTYTNSTLLDDAMIERIRNAGNLMPAISVEGFEKENKQEKKTPLPEKINMGPEQFQKFLKEKFGEVGSYSNQAKEKVKAGKSIEKIDAATAAANDTLKRLYESGL